MQDTSYEDRNIDVYDYYIIFISIYHNQFFISFIGGKEMTKIVNLTQHEIVIVGLTDMENGNGMHHIYPCNAESSTPCIICGVWRDEACDIPCGIAIPPSRKVARIEEKKINKGIINFIPFYKKVYGNIIDLPEPEDDTYYIVTLSVAQEQLSREDLLVVGETIEDDREFVVRTKSLARLW